MPAFTVVEAPTHNAVFIQRPDGKPLTHKRAHVLLLNIEDRGVAEKFAEALSRRVYGPLETVKTSDHY